MATANVWARETSMCACDLLSCVAMHCAGAGEAQVRDNQAARAADTGEMLIAAPHRAPAVWAGREPICMPLRICGSPCADRHSSVRCMTVMVYATPFNRAAEGSPCRAGAAAGSPGHRQAASNGGADEADGLCDKSSRGACEHPRTELTACRHEIKITKRRTAWRKHVSTVCV